ncbi:MAG: Holliday junction branch migration protein RuvA [Alphaproteobacteria bacterium]
MIGKLRGVIDAVTEDGVILDVNGVGYVVQVPARVADRLPPVGSELALIIETVVREDAIRLYGFAAAEEKAWFRLLQDVQGVGARTALAVLSVLSPEELISAIAAQDHVPVARANGVGPKLAKRIVMELKDKAPASSVVVPFKGAPAAAPAPKAIARADAISALVNLGLPQAQAAGVIDRTLARLGEDAKVEELIREGLKAVS